MTSRQCKLYQTFLNEFVNTRDKTKLNNHILTDYYIFSRIWTHPYLLVLHGINVEKKRIIQEDREFCVSDESSLSIESSKSDDDTTFFDKYK